MCGDRIEAATMQLTGVVSAEWELSTSQLTVTVDSEDFDINQVHYSVTAVGHDTELFAAKKEVYDDLPLCCQYRESLEEEVTIIDPETMDRTFQFFVDGICGMCKDRIETAVTELAGVKRVSWDVASRMITVVAETVDYDVMEVHKTVAVAGHDTELKKASKNAYNRLHACCKYRDEEVIASHRGLALEELQIVRGQIFELDGKGRKAPLIGVNVFWLDAGEGTATDGEGKFELDREASTSLLVASYVGFPSDTIDVSHNGYVEIILDGGVSLEGVEVVERRRSTEVSFVNPIKVLQMNERELHKAACCNLSESFETNPSIDVSFTDAVTGTKQIEMLGLAGPYVQISRELIPNVRGLSAIQGLTYIPGHWVESIQLSKGPGSVTNGFESMTGQINVELKKPEESEQLYLNLYSNEGGRFEGNLNLSRSFSSKWHSGLLLHGSSRVVRNDRNDDGFLDNPTGKQLMAVNRWRYIGGNGWEGQFGIKGLHIDRLSGQLSFDEEGPRNITNGWGATTQTRRLEGWAKMGRVFDKNPNSSMGLQLSGVIHDQEGTFGVRSYTGNQKSFYANWLFQSIIGTTNHQFTTGLSFQWDQFDENRHEFIYGREESVPGAFFEYTWQPDDKFTAVAGLRGDYHNIFGGFVTPRLHLRYAFAEESVLRFSTGHGRRTASIFAEHLGDFASARHFHIREGNPEHPYGLNQETSWNVGLNWTQAIHLGSKGHGKEILLSLDAYHTRFQQQVVVDYDQNPQEVNFYNLDGDSWSTSLQGQIDVELIERFDVRLAYRFNDVQVTYDQGQLEKPFVSRHRAFINTAYETADHWTFDLTVNWQGPQRIPSTASNPEPFRVAERSPDFVLINAQISKEWGNNLEIYLGVENLFNFTQDNPIIASDAPHGRYFDSTLVWAPIFGRTTYLGMRYRIL